MRRPIALPTALLLAAALAGCATPRQSCIYRATGDYRAAQEKIETIEENLERGYALHREQEPYFAGRTCYYRHPATLEVLPYSCSSTYWRTRTTPVAIDADLEKEKLQRLRRELPALQARAAAGTRQCQAQYPEEG